MTYAPVRPFLGATAVSKSGFGHRTWVPWPYHPHSTLCRSKYDSGLRPVSFRRSGGSLVLVDQAVQDRFSADPAGVEVCRGAMEGVRIPVRGALVDALVRPGGVVVLLILGQDGAGVLR